MGASQSFDQKVKLLGDYYQNQNENCRFVERLVRSENFEIIMYNFLERHYSSLIRRTKFILIPFYYAPQLKISSKTVKEGTDEKFDFETVEYIFSFSGLHDSSQFIIKQKSNQGIDRGDCVIIPIIVDIENIPSEQQRHNAAISIFYEREEAKIRFMIIDEFMCPANVTLASLKKLESETLTFILASLSMFDISLVEGVEKSIVYNYTNISNNDLWSTDVQNELKTSCFHTFRTMIKLHEYSQEILSKIRFFLLLSCWLESTVIRNRQISIVNMLVESIKPIIRNAKEFFGDDDADDSNSENVFKQCSYKYFQDYKQVMRTLGLLGNNPVYENLNRTCRSRLSDGSQQEEGTAVVLRNTYMDISKAYNVNRIFTVFTYLSNLQILLDDKIIRYISPPDHDKLRFRATNDHYVYNYLCYLYNYMGYSVTQNDDLNKLITTRSPLFDIEYFQNNIINFMEIPKSKTLLESEEMRLKITNMLKQRRHKNVPLYFAIDAKQKTAKLVLFKFADFFSDKEKNVINLFDFKRSAGMTHCLLKDQPQLEINVADLFLFEWKGKDTMPLDFKDKMLVLKQELDVATSYKIGFRWIRILKKEDFEYLASRMSSCYPMFKRFRESKSISSEQPSVKKRRTDDVLPRGIIDDDTHDDKTIRPFITTDSVIVIDENENDVDVDVDLNEDADDDDYSYELQSFLHSHLQTNNKLVMLNYELVRTIPLPGNIFTNELFMYF